MQYRTLSDFLEALAAAGELARVKVEVDRELEIAAITDRAVKADGPALLFERVAGHEALVVTNLFGTGRRICLALGCDAPEEFVERVGQLVENSVRPSWLDRLKSGAAIAPLEKFAPAKVKVAACQQVVKLGSDVALDALPTLRCWPEETNHSITSGLLLSVHPESGERRMSRQMFSVLDHDRLAVLWDAGSTVRMQLAAARQRNEPLPVAIVIGGPPAATLFADLPVLDQFDPLRLAGLWGESPLDVVTCRTQPLEVPAQAEMIIEGFFAPDGAAASSGRIAAPTGFYHERTGCDVIQATAITHKSNAAFVARVPSAPPSEATAVHRFSERLLLQAVQSTAPDIADLAIPSFAGPHGFLFVSIRKSVPQAARKVASAVWGHDALMMTKTIVVVDSHVDVHDTAAVMYRVGANVLPERDVFLQDGPVDPFDHALASQQGGRKLGIDATAKLPEERGQPWPAEAAADHPTLRLLNDRWKEYGLSLGRDGELSA